LKKRVEVEVVLLVAEYLAEDQVLVLLEVVLLVAVGLPGGGSFIKKKVAEKTKFFRPFFIC
jgi:hypothetical protein